MTNLLFASSESESESWAAFCLSCFALSRIFWKTKWLARKRTPLYLFNFPSFFHGFSTFCSFIKNFLPLSFCHFFELSSIFFIAHKIRIKTIIKLISLEYIFDHMNLKSFMDCHPMTISDSLNQNHLIHYQKLFLLVSFSFLFFSQFHFLSMFHHFHLQNQMNRYQNQAVSVYQTIPRPR